YSLNIATTSLSWQHWRRTERRTRATPMNVYFSQSKWTSLAEWEKKRYRNMKRNHLAIESRSPPQGPSDTVEEEWTPHLERKYQGKTQRRRENKSRTPSTASTSKPPQSRTPTASTSKPPQSRTPTASTSKPPQSRTPTASTSKPLICILCRESAVSHLSLSVCEECKSFFIEECELHGPPLFIPDTPAPLGAPDRARLTLPLGLEVRTSAIPGAGLGVFNHGHSVTQGTHYGPYEGELTNTELAMESGYSWVIYKSKQSDEYIDAKRDTHSNWMRYVNCARNEEEQNLVAFQYRGGILYRCCKPIAVGEELLVWYGEEYARDLGIGFDFLWDRKSSARGTFGLSLSTSLPIPFLRPSRTGSHCSLPIPFLRPPRTGSHCSLPIPFPRPSRTGSHCSLPIPFPRPPRTGSHCSLPIPFPRPSRTGSHCSLPIPFLRPSRTGSHCSLPIPFPRPLEQAVIVLSLFPFLVPLEQAVIVLSLFPFLVPLEQAVIVLSLFPFLVPLEQAVIVLSLFPFFVP
uniref:SET domain-containing protein n=1 Tax=Oncorhynchus tshawytscha TaxID=74940 RepID=A0AAZ3NNK7_ONCTS